MSAFVNVSLSISLRATVPNYSNNWIAFFLSFLSLSSSLKRSGEFYAILCMLTATQRSWICRLFRRLSTATGWLSPRMFVWTSKLALFQNASIAYALLPNKSRKSFYSPCKLEQSYHSLIYWTTDKYSITVCFCSLLSSVHRFIWVSWPISSQSLAFWDSLKLYLLDFLQQSKSNCDFWSRLSQTRNLFSWVRYSQNCDFLNRSSDLNTMVEPILAKLC